MACSCNSKRSSAPQIWTAALPDGRSKSYSTEVAARAEVARVPGAYLIPPGGTVQPEVVASA